MSSSFKEGGFQNNKNGNDGEIGKQFADDIKQDAGGFDSSNVKRMLVYTSNIGLTGSFTRGFDRVFKVVEKIITDLDAKENSGYIENESTRNFGNWVNYNPDFKPESKKIWDQKNDKNKNKGGNGRHSYNNSNKNDRNSVRNFNRNRYNNNQGREVQLREKSLTLRVPSDKYKDIVANLLKVGVDVEGGGVRDVNSSGNDVTSNYIDAESRAKTLEATRGALEKLMLAANGVKEVLEVQRELTNIIVQIERQREMAKYFRKASSLATIYLRINEDAPPKPFFKDEKADLEEANSDWNDDGWDNENRSWSPFKTLDKAFLLFGKSVTVAVDSMIYCVVLGLPIIVLIVGVMSFLWKKFGGKGGWEAKKEGRNGGEGNVV